MKDRVAFVLTALVATVALAQAPPAPSPQDQAPIDTSTVERILRGEDAVEQGQGFTYDPAGRRDPFRSLLGGRPPRRWADGRPACGGWESRRSASSASCVFPKGLWRWSRGPTP